MPTSAVSHSARAKVFQPRGEGGSGSGGRWPTAGSASSTGSSGAAVSRTGSSGAEPWAGPATGLESGVIGDAEGIG